MLMLRRFALIFVLFAAAAVRIGALVLFPDIFAFDQTGTIHGSAAYDTYAVNLIDTGVYGMTPGVADAMIPPLYSYALMGAYTVAGRSAWTVGGLHIALDLLSLLLLYAIVGRVIRGAVRTAAEADWVAILACAGAAFYPYLIFQNLTVIDTPFFMVLMHAFILACVLLRDQPRFDTATVALAIGAGLLLGVATLTRPILPVLAIGIAVWFLFRLSLGETIVRLAIVAIVAALTLVPWIARNQTVYGEFVPMSVTSGANFWQGNSPYTLPYLQAGYDVQWTSPDALTAPDPNSPAADRERFALALAFLRDNPDLIPDLIWTKFRVHWSIDIAPRLNPTAGELPRLDYQGDAIAGVDPSGELTIGGLPPGDAVDAYSTPLFDQIGRLIHRIYFGAALLLAIGGLIVSLRGWRDASLLAIVQIAMTVVYVLFHPSTRYRAPTDPLLFALSALAVVTVVGWAARRLSRPRYGAPSSLIDSARSRSTS